MDIPFTEISQGTWNKPLNGLFLRVNNYDLVYSGAASVVASWERG